MRAAAGPPLPWTTKLKTLLLDTLLMVPPETDEVFIDVFETWFGVRAARERVEAGGSPYLRRLTGWVLAQKASERIPSG